MVQGIISAIRKRGHKVKTKFRKLRRAVIKTTIYKKDSTSRERDGKVNDNKNLYFLNMFTVNK